MSTLERPRLRPYLDPTPDESDPSFVVLEDQLRLGGASLRLNRDEYRCVRLFDGNRTLREVQAETTARAGGPPLPLELVARLARALDDRLFLDGPRYRQRLDGPVREPSCLGCYQADPAALRRQLHDLFTDPRGAGLPRADRRQGDGQLRAALLPHIDYRRGGVTYTWGFKEVAERTDASLFVIVGTSHCSAARFTLTRKHFKTPLGVVETDQGYVERLAAHHGDGLFADEHLAHLPEWSIELEVVFLQYLYEGRRPFRIVPLVVGSFRDCVEEGTEPAAREDVARMVAALRRAEAEAGEPVCYLISGDLAHVGPGFGDPGPLAAPFLRRSRARDLALLRRAEAADPGAFFREVAAEGDRRRICGLPPAYVTLAALRPARGKVLRYDQYVHPRGRESVSFASVAFYR
jgi:AmmeMemoRadiSam system protein B